MKNAWDLCELIRCALAGEMPRWEQMDLPAVHQLAKSQTLTAISYMALEGTAAAAQLDPAWKQERDMAVRKNLLLTAERQQILREMDALGCWYLPLKGSVLAGLYPKLGMRQMADNDILFDPAYRKKVKEIFLNLGYECEVYGKSNHDVYLKAPVYNFEMHVALFDAYVFEKGEEYFRDVAQRLLQDGKMGRKFTDEDFYLYFLAHGHKHFSGGGNGLRFLADCYVYLKERKLDWDYLAAELEKLRLTAFEALVRNMAQKLFGTGEALTEEEQKAFAYCISSGTYGTFANRISNQLREIQPEGKIGAAAKLKYMLRRLWPDMAWFREFAPFFAKWWILQPFFVVWRLFKGPITNGKNILRELRTISKDHS